MKIKALKERKNALKNLKTCKGQIEGIIKMIEDERYCIDISNQIMASISILKKANLHILEGHLNSCVKDSLCCEEAKEKKIEEMVNVIKRMTTY